MEKYFQPFEPIELIEPFEPIFQNGKYFQHLTIKPAKRFKHFLFRAKPAKGKYLQPFEHIELIKPLELQKLQKLLKPH